MIYDRFQKEAIHYIDEGFSVVVSAPTGSGKTAIAEHVIRDCLVKNQGVIYTAPLKALSNQKFRDFHAQFKDSVGILTGDVSINAQAPLLIMTTEILRNKILDEPRSLRPYKWIIFDEIHYIDNPERGTVWEESLIFLPQHLKMLCLSATIPNIKEFCQWIESVHKKPIKTVEETKRPVPLTFLYQYKNEILGNINDLKRSHYYGRPNILTTLINYIRSNLGLPCIYFVFSRRRAEELAFELYNYNFLNENEQKEINALYKDLCSRYELTSEASQIRMRPLIQRGIAYHHAGMLPTLKEVVERLFTSRLIKVIFTTETFALGINMPARSVIFDSLRKFYGRFVRNLLTRDFYQMAGRAGRRGMDREGFVYCRVPVQMKIDEVKQIIYGRPEEIRSQFNTSYATILNLYETYQEGLLDIYPRSLHYFQSNKLRRRDGLELMKAKLRLLREMGYLGDGSLTAKGQFARSLYGYELILSEFNEQGVLENLDAGLLSVLAVAIAFEPRKNQKFPRISKKSKNIEQACHEIIEPIQRKEAKYRVRPLSKQPFFHLAPCTEAWLNGSPFENILRLTDTDEGEVVRYFRMGVQILREIIRGAHTSSNLLKDRVNGAIRAINRDIVDAEKQLREG